MPFIEGFLTPVPTANKEVYTKHASEAAPYFQKLGATRFVEAWGDDVPDGKVNDLKKAVDLKDDETVLFSWIEYPDKATRDSANEKMRNDPAMAEMAKDMPFDATRMIFAGFEPIVDTGESQQPGYVDGIVLAVPEASKDSYKAFNEQTSAIFREYGALRVVESWGEPIPDGKVTDFNRATLREDGERVVFSWIEWPSKQHRDDAWAKIMQDERMRPPSEPVFDGKRMMWGGFSPIVQA